MDVEQAPAPAWPRQKFRHRYLTHITLFLATLATTTIAGAVFHYPDFRYAYGGFDKTAVPPFSWASGLWYSVPMLLILGAHEFGHYIYCRKRSVDASLPYFLPAPLPLTGTLGAVIRIKEAFPTTRALFDIGVAGPIAGFVVLVPLLYWGLAHSAVVSFPTTDGLIYFGEPLLLKAMAYWHFGTLPPGVDITLHPVAFAAWFGMLATALNLLPFGQLDGGHIAYAVFGPRARTVSIVTLGAIVLLTVRSLSWMLTALVMLAMAIFLGLRHPRVLDETEPLDSTRLLVAALAAVIFLLCFTPVPIETFM